MSRVVQDKLFYPWGQDWLLAGSLYEGRFAKLRHRDTETGLDPTYYRMFSSNQGRWLSPDPVRGGVGNPQTLSLYPYVANNATNRVDPKGDILADPYGPCGCGYSSDDPGFPSVLCPAPPSPTPTGQCPPGYIFYFDVGQYLECVALEAGIASGACVFAVSACIASGGNPFVCGFAVLACGYTYSRVKACADAAKHCIPGPLTALP